MPEHPEIPEAAVERFAQRHWDAVGEGKLSGQSWRELSLRALHRPLQDRCRREARDELAAVLPDVVPVIHADLRERVLSEKAVEAASDVFLAGDCVEASFPESAMRAALEAALDSIGLGAGRCPTCGKGPGDCPDCR